VQQSLRIRPEADGAGDEEAVGAPSSGLERALADQAAALAAWCERRRTELDRALDRLLAAADARAMDRRDHHRP